MWVEAHSVRLLAKGHTTFQNPERRFVAARALTLAGYLFGVVGRINQPCIGYVEEPDIDAFHYVDGPKQPTYRVTFHQKDLWEGYQVSSPCHWTIVLGHLLQLLPIQYGCHCSSLAMFDQSSFLLQKDHVGVARVSHLLSCIFCSETVPAEMSGIMPGVQSEVKHAMLCCAGH